MATILYNQAKEYVDIDFLFSKHPESNNVSVKKRINAVKQSIINLLLLRKGDKPFHPEIYSPFGDFLFESISPVMEVVLADEIYKYLAIYEPRARILQVDIQFPRQNEITCLLSCELINVFEPFTVNVLVSSLR